MPHKPPLLLFALLLVGCASTQNIDDDSFLFSQHDDSPPNILFIFADDWGFGDLGSHGHAIIETPNLDALATQGTDFHQFTVASGVCSPSRAGLMTGRFPARYNINRHFATIRHHQNTGMPDWLDPTALTIPRILQGQGYATYHLGKWHLTSRYVTDAPPVTAYGYDRTAVWNGPDPSIDPHEIFDLAIDVINSAQDGGQPFFINLWLNETHTPHFPTDRWLEHYAQLGLDERERVYPAVASNADEQIGRVLAALDEAGLTDDTLVIFTSDNGPEYPLENRARTMNHDEIGSGLNTWYSLGSAGGLRGAKRSLHEGGVRVPLIVRWPGRVPAGVVNETSVITAVDWLPTLSRVVGAELPQEYVPDGEDRTMDLLGQAQTPRTMPIYWYWPNGRGGENWPQAAVRVGQWKLLMTLDGERIELYDIPNDRAETNNLADAHPQVVAQLRTELTQWLAELPDSPAPSCLSQLRNP